MREYTQAEKKEIKINCSKWRTGTKNDNATGKGRTTLINEEGFKCCLGFICQQKTKKNKNNFIDNTEPGDLGFYVEGLNTLIIESYASTILANDAIDINDSDIPLEDKKEQLRLLFNENPNSPYKLTFYGKPVSYHV